MELRFRRSQQETEESASVVIKSGDTIDESMAAFDAVNLSGALKKALMSLSVGMYSLLSTHLKLTSVSFYIYLIITYLYLYILDKLQNVYKCLCMIL